MRVFVQQWFPFDIRCLALLQHAKLCYKDVYEDKINKGLYEEARLGMKMLNWLLRFYFFQSFIYRISRWLIAMISFQPYNIELRKC